MAKKKEFNIGEEFDFGLIRVRCVEVKSNREYCPKSCVFKGLNCLTIRNIFVGECVPDERTDGKSVCFKKIAKNK